MRWIQSGVAQERVLHVVHQCLLRPTRSQVRYRSSTENHFGPRMLHLLTGAQVQVDQNAPQYLLQPVLASHQSWYADMFEIYALA